MVRGSVAASRVLRYVQRHTHQWKRLAISFGLAATLTLVPASVGAQTIDSLQQQRQQLLQQIETIRSRSNTLEQQENQARNQLGLIQSSLEAVETRLEDSEFRLARAQEELTKLEERLKTSEEQLKRQRESAANRLRHLQKQGREERWWALMLNSADLNEFFDRRYYFRLLMESDRALIKDLQHSSEDIEQERISLEAQKNEIALLQQQLAAEKASYETQEAQQTQLISRLQNERAAHAAAQRRLEADSQQLSTMIQRLAIQQTQQSGFQQGTGQMIHPVSGPVTSPYGWRTHPVYRTRRLHTGIDYGVAVGTPVHAADSGTILYSGWYGGYGYTVIINHGGGLTTLYAHNSRLFVSKDQHVAKGQQVAGAGSTGLSTGPHVHFEVRKNGQPVDPGAYL
ncbi:MAG: peptidoglycan DD-metalloendopeptidase family protein [Cyanobacteria bacterium P01_E01_bin.34]